jgi:hypothetical protein
MTDEAAELPETPEVFAVRDSTLVPFACLEDAQAWVNTRTMPSVWVVVRIVSRPLLTAAPEWSEPE